MEEKKDSAAGASSSDSTWRSGLLAPRWPGPDGRPGEPSFTRADVAACDGSGADGRLLVTYRDGVYDVTDYIREHPGRHFLMSAAGGPVDPWWGNWMQHHNSPLVAAALERLRVGRLSDYVPFDDEESCGGGLWAEEQLLASRAKSRQSSWRLTEMPYQSVTHSACLAEDYLTPRDFLYVRNHGPVPSVSAEDADDHTLSFCIGSEEVASLNLLELQNQFHAVQVTSTLQCAGNRGADNLVANGVQGSGFPGTDAEFIGLGMLGNIRWSGVRLVDVVQALIQQSIRAGWRTEDLHVTFEGLDGYYTSTPLKHIMDQSADCLLATKMNGQPLSPDHGFPVRVVLPGIAGARQVKWLSKVTIGPLSDDPWTCHYYRDKPSMVPIQKLPMNSAILSPEPGAQVSAGETSVCIAGVAYGGGTGEEVTSVQVSADRGQTWQDARCLVGEVDRGDAVGPYRGWVRWEVEVPLSRAQGLGCGAPLQELWCRSFSSSGGSQPECSAQHGGYLFNGYHKVPIVRR